MKSDSSAPHVAIIGGGFSGVLTLANFVALAKFPLRITLYESKSEPGQGVAYSTNDTVHLLNVRADRMGAMAGKPDHFWQWLQSDVGKTQTQQIWPGRVLQPGHFAPRRLYRAYIQDILKHALADALGKQVVVNIVHAEIKDMPPSFADAVVLATGNGPPKAFGFAGEGSINYIADIWHPPQASCFPDKVATLPEGSTAVIIGTGLTAVDAILTLKKNNFKGAMVAISRGGLLPAAHTSFEPYPDWEWTINPANAPKTALGMLATLRKEAGKAKDWRAVIDSLRPLTQALWQSLPLTEQRKFMRRLFTFWNIHRHRMAPEIAEAVGDLINSGRLHIISAKIADVSEKLVVRYKRRGEPAQEIQAALVINCTGPDWRLEHSPNPLITSLLKQGLIQPHPLGLGMKPQPGSRIFPIGPLMIGELLESVAVPELREQAFTVAADVLKSLQRSKL